MCARHAQTAFDALLVDPQFKGEILLDELMAKHTSFRIGGPARYYARVGSLGSLKRLLAACAESGIPWYVAGRGSNLLVADAGYEGVVITLSNDFANFRYDEDTQRFYAGGGVLLSLLVQESFRRCLAGLEFLVDTPGSVGGALSMNAGTSSECIGTQVESVTILTKQQELVRLDKDELLWGYRKSSFEPGEIIVECELRATPADPFYIRGKMEGFRARRRKTQPLSVASCGSMFINPPDMSAGKLIEDAGCKGLSVGGACVSDMHANFIVNEGKATAHDVVTLIEIVQAKVFECYGVKLKPEVRFLGFA
ncbi:UDP-N-acetylmuramate dehydrogenase [Adlercreutzia agrestimuris]|uniref:UDP-N-acetylmuramate dehydrogenase n=1 Tax=Adlercreutzia agrestimuris TaxID=2941324 RepID=UPI00204076E4|nr:UDP-N-acetylmuramate dehydrogenase [Adlercreutzia agrestimuris]